MRTGYRWIGLAGAGAVLLFWGRWQQPDHRTPPPPPRGLVLLARCPVSYTLLPLPTSVLV